MPERRARARGPSVPRRPAATAARGAAGRVKRRAPVRVLFLDVDGTLTDGVIAYTAAGDLRNFWVRDGLALEWAKQAGLLPVVISGREAKAVETRMQDLKLESYLGASDKVAIA